MNKRGGDAGHTGPPTYPLLRVRSGRSQAVSPSTLPHLRAGRFRLIWGRFFPAVFGRFFISFWPFFPIILLNLINGGIRLLWPLRRRPLPTWAYHRPHIEITAKRLDWVPKIMAVSKWGQTHCRHDKRE